MSQVTSNHNWKTKVLIIGTAIGALVGLGTAYLLARTAEENNDGPPKIKTGPQSRCECHWCYARHCFFGWPINWLLH